MAIGSGDGPPTLLLDAGTGLANLAAVMEGAPFTGTILLTHLHWDHTHGLPFSSATDNDDAKVDLRIPEQPGQPLDLLAQAMAPPAFPITPTGLRGEWRFGSISEGRHHLDEFEVIAREIPHKGGRTFGYRVTAADGASLAYLPDHQPSRFGPGETAFGPLHEAALALADRVDLLLHDGQYTDDEFRRMHHFGHAAIGYAVALAEASNARRLMIFHHAPTRSDDELDDLAERWADWAAFAREGMQLTVAAAEPSDTPVRNGDPLV